MCERERERERQRDRDRDRETERQRETETETERGIAPSRINKAILGRTETILPALQNQTCENNEDEQIRNRITMGVLRMIMKWVPL